MQRARAELTWERTAAADARPLRASARRARRGDACSVRGPTWAGPDRSGGASAGFPWHPGVHAAPLLHPRAVRVRARSRRRRRCRFAARHARAAGRRGRLRLGCRRRSAARRARGLDDARAVALSPDGLVALRRRGDAGERDLVQRRARATACCSSSTSAPAASPRSRRTAAAPRAALEGASAIVVSPDNLHVYVASATAAAVDELRAPAQRIARPARRHRRLHLQRRLRPAAPPAPSLGGADAIAISPDGRFVYVAGDTADSLLVFSRDAATGRLTPARRHGGLPARRTAPTARRSPASTGPRRSRSRRTGRRSTSPRSAGTLTSFQRDVTTGTLTQLAPGVGCLSDGALADCTPIGGLARASAVAITPDGHTRDRRRHRRRRGALVPARSGHRRAHARVLRRGSAATAGCTPSTLIAGPARPGHPTRRAAWSGSRRPAPTRS